MPTPNLLSGLNASISVSGPSGVSGGGPILGLSSISGPSMEMGTCETTNLSSSVRSFRYTILDPGTLNFSLQYDPSNSIHTFLKVLMTVPKICTWVVTETDPVSNVAQSFSFSGVLTGFEVGEASIDSIVEVSCTVKISGLIT